MSRATNESGLCRKFDDTVLESGGVREYDAVEGCQALILAIVGGV